MTTLVGLWNQGGVSNTLYLTNARSGSVYFDVVATDSGDGTAQARFAQMSSDLANPNSALSQQFSAAGMRVISTSSGSPVPLGLIIGAAVAGTLLIAGIVVLIVVLVKRHQRENDSKYTPLLDMNRQDHQQNHEIGAPYGMEHKAGEGNVKLVGRDTFQRKQASQVSVAVGAGAGTPTATSGARRFRLIAEVRDKGEGVLTGAPMGADGVVEEKDFQPGVDWLWATVLGRSGWIPANHLQWL